MIRVENLNKSYHNKVALENVSFEVKKGEIFGFLGPSGSGKTTTINILTGQLTADSGEAFILNKNSRDLLPDDFYNIGIMSDTVGFYEKMTVYKNLQFFAEFHDVNLSKLDDLLRKLDLFEDRHKKAQDLSTGMKQRMLLIRAILHNPEILFLDEPTSGLDPVLSDEVHKILLDLKHSGTTIFLTTHDMQEATKLCDQIALLHSGEILEYGKPQDVIDKYSHKELVTIRFKNGESKIVKQAEVVKYINLPEVDSIHTVENSLENVFIKLSRESRNEKI